MSNKLHSTTTDKTLIEHLFKKNNIGYTTTNDQIQLAGGHSNVVCKEFLDRAVTFNFDEGSEALSSVSLIEE